MHALDMLARLERALAPAGAALASPPNVRDAAVAAIFRIAEGDALELLMIERARYAGDPWSGHIAFPGGRRELRDATLLDTALRETREETGIDLLTFGRVLGALDRVNPVSPALPPLSISPFVAHLTEDAPLALSEEVA
ncbi:MAG: NUDIX hydrolase, partial [Gemmatimonas sp.]